VEQTSRHVAAPVVNATTSISKLRSRARGSPRSSPPARPACKVHEFWCPAGFISSSPPDSWTAPGNCGSAIELDEGWLLFTHGVGPVRKYSIGAALLDKKDPTKVIARSREPLVHPDPSQREGYVPNVVYTCGAIRHGERIILPYAVSDTFSDFATIRIGNLLSLMR